MTSSAEPKPNYSRRFYWLAAFIVLLFGGYSLGWFWLAGRLESQSRTIIAELNRDGVTADCVNQTVRGFPFRLGLFCDNVSYEDSRTQISARAGSLRSAAQIYQPTRLVLELDGPLVASGPGMAPLKLNWELLHASARMALPLPQRLSVEAKGLTGQFAPDGTTMQPLFTAASAEGHLRPNGNDIDWAGSFTGLAVDANVLDGRQLPLLNGSADATLTDGIALIEGGAKSLRGTSGTIRTLSLATSDATDITLSGPFSIDADGLIDATLRVTVRDPRGVSTALGAAFPEAKRQIEQGFAGLALLGREPSLPLRIVKGRATLGFIPLGQIPPVR